MPVLFSVFSALVCTQSLIFNKAVMVLWRMTLAGDNQVRPNSQLPGAAGAWATMSYGMRSYTV
jgi:hypothetical protein